MPFYDRAQYRLIDISLSRLQHERNYQLLAIVIVTLFAAALRFYKLGQWSFWIEEHHSIRGAVEFEWSLTYIASMIRPLYFLLLVPSFDLLGVNEWSARLASAFIGILTVPVVYCVSRKIRFDYTVALGAALIAAISPWHIYWSQNARFYSLLLLLGAGSTYAFYWGVETNKQRYIYLSVILLGLAGITHSIAAILLPIYITYLLLLRLPYWKKPPGANVRNLLPFVALPLIGYISLELVRVFIFQDDPIIRVVYTRFFNEATASYIGYESPLIMVTSFVYYIGIPVAFFSIIGAWVSIRNRNRAGLMLVISAFVPLGIMTLLTFFASTANRYAFLSLFSWFILASAGFYEVLLSIKNRRRSLVWLLPLLLVFLWRDPAIKDIIYYLQSEPTFRFIVLAIPSILGIVFFYHYRPHFHENRLAILTLLAMVILFAHPLLVDFMYFQYQDGHRDNLKAASSYIHTEGKRNDVVVSSVKPLTSYYIDANVVDIGSFEKVLLEREENTIWFIEDYGTELVDRDKHIASLLQDHCVLRQNFDHFVAGRSWKLRVHICN